MSSGLFTQVTEAPPDAIFGLNVAFKADPAPDKLNIVVGAYRTEEGKPLVLDSVKKAEEIILHSKDINKEYLAIDGLAEFNKAAAQLLFGDQIYKSLGSRIATMQTLSGTGSLRVAGEFIKRFMPNSTVYLSDPTWPNHKNIFPAAGVQWKPYRYYDSKANKLDYDGFIADIKAAPEGSVILLHACAHNPTGLDPTEAQWNGIADVIKDKRHVTLIDCAYQGFASGDLYRDAAAIRLFIERGLEIICCQSFAKNMGLYGERVGAIHVVTNSEGACKAVISQLKTIARASYSNPPAHGAYIVSTILNNQQLIEQWKVELKGMSDRIALMRQMLYDECKKRGIEWPHILQQIGMFAYTGLNAKQVELLKSKHHIYLTSDGRVSLPGLSTKTVVQLANAVEDVCKGDAKL
eukprot:TRINITY_DN2643_c0_g1_i1.p1 TRINITY_DN2643_c0_g1~~TRINITY_DN2643_c0_g1_i1.p1  ORF type:complete len:434 (+),score=91.51 TRINITY_DN2643_c0_g1_i1:83-1303(+)